MWVAKAWYADRPSAQGLALLLTVVGVLFLEMVSRRLAWVDPERLARTLVPFYVVVHRIASPLVAILGGLTSGLARLAGSPLQSRPAQIAR